jgi:hypothetical protein
VAQALLIAWGLALVAFLGCYAAIAQLAQRDHLAPSHPADPVTPVTLTAAAVTFAVIYAATRGRDRPVRLTAAATGAIAAPMIFEFPFDLIVMARISTLPLSVLILFFAPLFAIEFTTVALLALSGLVRIRRSTIVTWAAMLAVFALWAAVARFAYPNAPLPFAFNVASKLLSFATVLTLFPLRRAQAQAPAEAPSSIPSSASATTRSAA